MTADIRAFWLLEGDVVRIDGVWDQIETVERLNGDHLPGDIPPTPLQVWTVLVMRSGYHWFVANDEEVDTWLT